ncbi:hypothetical protein H6800_02020 [Candidatus Nomurabacteria bacterium]|nr:hypothetical protein [Candidatus Nomurabacteria bacterium]
MIEQPVNIQLNHLKYIVVLSIYIIFAILLYAATNISMAVAESQSGGVTVSATVPGEPPQVAAQILSPISGSRFDNQSITVSGTCESGKIIQIYKNEIFAGSTLCSGGVFNLKVDLVYGKNDLVAKTYDSLNQKGPDSSTITVYFDNQSSNASDNKNQSYTNSSLALEQLVVITDNFYQGVIVESSFTLSSRVMGGQAPYAVYVSWGDGKEDLVLQPSSDEFEIQHVYKFAGDYKVSVKAVDSLGNKASIQTMVIVNGKPIVYAPSFLKNPTKTLPILTRVWQIYIIVVLSTFSFWLGERWLLHRYKRASLVK